MLRSQAVALATPRLTIPLRRRVSSSDVLLSRVASHASALKRNHCGSQSSLVCVPLWVQTNTLWFLSSVCIVMAIAVDACFSLERFPHERANLQTWLLASASDAFSMRTASNVLIRLVCWRFQCKPPSGFDAQASTSFV